MNRSQLKARPAQTRVELTAEETARALREWILNHFSCPEPLPTGMSHVEFNDDRMHSEPWLAALVIDEEPTDA